MNFSCPYLTDKILKKLSKKRLKYKKDLRVFSSLVLCRKTCSNLLSSETMLYQYGHLLLAFRYTNNMLEEIIPEKMQQNRGKFPKGEHD